MRSLRIFVNDIELDHVREDLKVRQENSSFFASIKVAHNTQPVRIVENAAVVKAMGEFSIAAANKKKLFPCKVVMGAVRYNGIITQNDKIKGFRKCDLKYGSEINGIMDKKIASFFPAYNVKGEENVAYEAESITSHNAFGEWVDHALDIERKIFPEVNWQLPRISYKDKFGTDLNEDDSHYEYRGHINHRNVDGLSTNTFTADDSTNTVSNQQLVSPQVFILSPLHYAFSSLGYSLQGNVMKSSFFKRLLLLSFNDNMTKIVKRVTGINIDLSSVDWVQGKVYQIFSVGYPTYLKTIQTPMTSEGDFKVAYKWEMDLPPEEHLHMFGIQVYWNGELIGKETRFVSAEGSFSFSVSPIQVNDDVQIIFHSTRRVSPMSYSFEVIKDLPQKDFFDAHPTIDFSRYIPEWTVAEYLNNFQNLFNWRVDIDDVEKSVSINSNQEDYLIGGAVEAIGKSLEISSIKNIETESYILKYENDEDSFHFISQELSEADKEGDDNTEVLETKFKHIPYGGGTSELSKKVEDKSGIGLMIYDPTRQPSTSDSYQGRNLNITGEGGIFETDWRPWLLFRLNAGNAKLKGPFTQTELYIISRKLKLYIDNQLWLVKAIEYKENSSALFETELELESVSF